MAREEINGEKRARPVRVKWGEERNEQVRVKWRKKGDRPVRVKWEKGISRKQLTGTKKKRSTGKSYMGKKGIDRLELKGGKKGSTSKSSMGFFFKGIDR